MYWQDERLAYINTGYEKRLALNAKMVQHMWIPDIYFVNEKSGIKHDLTKENEVVRLWPDGRVFHSMRYVTHKSSMTVCNSVRALFSKTLALFKTEIFDFPYLIYDMSKNSIPYSANPDQYN